MERNMGKQMRAGIKEILVMVFFITLGQSTFAMDCKNVGSRCIEGSEEREVDGYKVHKSCWKYEDTLECKYSSKDNCKSLREEGCIHISQNEDGKNLDECLKEHEGKCLNYKKNYVCYTEQETEDENKRIVLENQQQEKKIKCSGALKCLDGSCFSSDENKKEQQKENQKDMLDAISQITAARDMAKDQEKNGDVIVSVFKGEAMRCTKNPTLKFRDCCGAKPEGFGVNWGLARCNADAKAMMERRASGHCIDLGTYCSNRIKVPGFSWCTTRKQTYCCFGGKLQKIIHEQGRPQLGIGFGSAKHPDCRGFTVEELSRLNFDKITFDDFHKDVLDKYKTPNAAEQNSRISDAFKSIQQDFESSDGDNLEPKDKTNQVPFRNKKFKSEVVDEDTGISSNRAHM